MPAPIFARLALVQQRRNSIKRNYCLKIVSQFTRKIVLQGLGKNSHGLSDTLVSFLSIRTSEILEELK